MLPRNLYNTVLCQAFSSCGKYLIAGNIYSQLAVFDLDLILNPVVELLTSEFNKPKYLHTLEESKQICSLASTDKFLIVGTESQIVGLNWKSVISAKLGKPSWVIQIPSVNFAHEQLDVNSLWVTEDEEKLYAGCGDNNIYCYALEDGQKLTKFEGHTDFIHSVHGKDKSIISAAEDGYVKIWDPRTGKVAHSVQPHENNNVMRPELGKWVGSATLGEDWFVCGGGPRASLWHLRSLDCTTVFDIPDRGIHVSFFNEDCVVLAGVARHLYQVTYSGDIKVELPVSSTTVYSAILRTEPNKILSVAGSSPHIDFCTTFNYRDQILNFR